SLCCSVSFELDVTSSLIFPPLASFRTFGRGSRKHFRVMEDSDVTSFLSSVSKTEVDKILRRIQAHPNVVALMLTNREGQALRTNMDITTTKNYALLYGNLIEMAHSAVRELDPQNKLQFIRVRNKQHEIIVAPTGELTLIVVQQVVIAV
ncbi:unnamed protein product, partial [Porites evermanni]